MHLANTSGKCRTARSFARRSQGWLMPGEERGTWRFTTKGKEKWERGKVGKPKE
jgi:hypothetical protein